MDIRAARGLLARYNPVMVRSEFLDVDVVEKYILTVQGHLNSQPKYYNKDDKRELFVTTIKDILEELVSLRTQAHHSNSCYPFKGKSIYMQETAKSINPKTGKPVRPLEFTKNMAAFRARMDERDRTHILMGKDMKRVLLKLFAIRCIMGDRKFSRFKEVPDDETALLKKQTI